MIIGCEETGTGVVVDPGGEPDRIIALLQKYRLQAVYLLHTHAHIDHIGATEAVRVQTGASAALHEDDMFLVRNMQGQATFFSLPSPGIPHIDRLIKQDDTLPFGQHKVDVVHTPGHTPGSVSFFVPTLGLLTGDTLFCGSIGRTDLWGGSYPTLLDSIKQKLFSFPDETRVYPGHGPSTTIGDEKQWNPFVGGEIL